MSLSAGTWLGPYEIQSVIGAGDMGEVYQARDTRLGRKVAIKVLPASASSDPDRQRRFEQEARAASALNHPHICAIYDFGYDTPRPSGAPRSSQSIGDESSIRFIVMEYLEGPSLATRLRSGPVPLKQALEYGAQIADALARAHGQGIVHRDLKPGNVVLTKDGAKLLDFGLAKLKPRAEGPRDALGASMTTMAPATAPGMVVGTVPYMPPEQLEGRETDARSDIFSFGCLIYEMLTGRRAFGGDSDASVISAIMSGEPPAVSTLLPTVPPALDRLVRKCLAKDPDARWQHAGDVAEQLRGISQDSGAGASAVPAALHLRRRGTRAIVAIGIAAVAISAAWLAFTWLNRSRGIEHFSLAMPGRAVFSCLDTSTACLAAAPDGSGVAYQATESGERAIYWNEIGSGVARRLVPLAISPFFSPDSRWLGFVRDRKIWKIALDKGRIAEGMTPIEVCEAGSVRGVAWLADDTIIFANPTGGLRRVSASGGNPVDLTHLDASRRETSHRFPGVLPSGHAVLYQIEDGTNRPERSVIAVLTLDTGQSRRIIEGGVYPRYLPSGQIVFSRRGTLFAVRFDLRTLTVSGQPVPVLNDVWYDSPPDNAGFDVTADGSLVYISQAADRPRNQLVWVERDGRQEPAAQELLAYGPGVTISPDGQRLAVIVESEDHYKNVWAYHLRERRWQRLRVEADCRYLIAWAPDSSQVAFMSNADGIDNIYAMAIDGDGALRRLTNSPRQQFVSSWSPDGRLIAYTQQDFDTGPGAASLNSWAAPLDGSGKPWLIERGATSAAFSPDGRWMLLQSAGASVAGQFDIYIRPFPGPGASQRIPGSGGGLGPMWGKDGRTFYYVEQAKSTRIMSRRIESFTPLRVSEPQVAFALPFPLDNPMSTIPRAFAVDPSGTRVLVVRPDERAAIDINTLQFVRAWQEEVKAKAGR